VAILTPSTEAPAALHATQPKPSLVTPRRTIGTKSLPPHPLPALLPTLAAAAAAAASMTLTLTPAAPVLPPTPLLAAKARI
jgi:hypothetical protein